MVAKITVPKSLKRALLYNEQKVQQGVANCLYAHQFLKVVNGLSFEEKRDRFERLMALNKRATTNALHISLNFGVNEQLSTERLTLIACTYMEQIGFGEQPYLVYQHLDTAHPHVHIVTTNIQPDGRRIPLHNIGRDHSEKARQAIEVAFGLQRAGGQRKGMAADVKPTDVQRLVYGKGATKGGIEQVLAAVLPRYKYASLPELNAVLGLFNVMADRGAEGSTLYQKRGLLYRVLDKQGHPIGVPVTASSIATKPTLDYLEGQFVRHAAAKPLYKKQLKGKLDWLLLRPPAGLAAFGAALQRENISLVIRKNEAGVVYGLTYVDHHCQCVFNGSELGKAYSAKGVCQRLGEPLHPHLEPPTAVPRCQGRNRGEEVFVNSNRQQPLLNLVSELARPLDQSQPVPFEWRKQKKKRRKSP